MKNHLPPPDVLLQEAMIQLTQEVLLALIRDASKLVVAQTMAQFAAHHPMNPPPPSPRQSRELSSAPKENGVEDNDPMWNQNNNALVILGTLSNFWVKNVLVDNGSSADIIFYNAYIQLRIKNDQLQKVNTPLTGFSGQMINSLGEVILPLSLGSYPKWFTEMVKFFVFKAPSTNNIILGRPSLILFRAIASTFHMKHKFPLLTLWGKL
ncbi:UNVERIFIED_CONTAM: hypothetical protein Scaly_1812500 [Sesamum calycinum]|uniref:Uncharacterized protein n=1 Tax=Sesamum calycinum TaxID=2727403 RepID=A0AAW2NF29_9LAMI